MICVGDYIARNARRSPNKIALVDGTRRLTYADLDRETDALARAMRRAGVRHGDRVGILAAASTDWVKTFIALAKTGAIAAGLNYRETPDRLAAMMRAVETTRLFVDAERRVLLDGIDGLPAMIDLSESTLRAMEEDHATADEDVVAVEPSDGAVILFTGGTTGASKGVLLSHANLFWNILNEALFTRMSDSDTTIVATALHHSAALNTWLLPHLYLGATAVILPEFTPEGWIDAVEREKATNGFTPPTMARQIVNHPRAKTADWSSFRRWYAGAGILPRHERAAMEALIPGLGIYYQYGLTEAGPIVTCLLPEDYERAPDSIGRIVPNCELRILREDRSVAEPGEVGELAVRGPAVMSGYFRQPAETAKVFHEDWLLTGDLGVMDEAGFVTFHDRSKDMIKTGGLNVYSQEVEFAIARHPGVREVAVLGLPDDHWGEVVTAVVTLHDARDATERDIIDFARRDLGGYQTPKRVIFMAFDDLPKNYLGKILKRELRDMLRQETPR
ncbi:class I adenylate-forming enzyme family protein [Microbaculum marinisediminis]|uniref:class I adenylate-forming enzyme family protein n=1 Tax=Microbaculum marinisediminis TaxID=2931392 RepID=UPI0021BE86CA|nr:AMP-binding protein [Microbaculum sp. A6E488]